MPDPKFNKPWHGVPRESIDWHPTVNADACIGCGTCVTGCGRLVYRFDYERKKPMVVDPLNCMVGCTTCAASDPHFRATLTARHDSLGFRAPAGVKFHMGTVHQALAENELDLRSRDAYVAGPAKTVAAVVEVLLKKGMSSDHILVDSMGCEQHERGWCGDDSYPWPSGLRQEHAGSLAC